MDLLTHIVSGAAVGGTVGQFTSKKGSVVVFSIIGALGGMLPDIDAISLWSKFDATIGQWLHLSNPGHVIYSEKFWYSHHGFTHSLLAPVLYCFLLFIGLSIVHNWRNKNTGFFDLKYLAFILAYWTHLIEDLPTPDGPWGGIRLFFPSSVYVGGTGQIWWWNNYDIFLLCLSLLASNFLIHFLVPQRKKWRPLVSVFVTLTIAFCIVYQITHRPYDFSYNGDGVNYEFLEAKSLEIQEKILGPWLFSTCQSLDNLLPLYF